MNEKPEFVCCICGNHFSGYGNNPHPLVTDEGARCCDECNALVIEARICKISNNHTRYLDIENTVESMRSSWKKEDVKDS